MARRMSHGELDRSGPQPLSMRERHLGRRRRREAESHPETLLRKLIVERAVAGVQRDGSARGRVDGGDSLDVVQVGVGEPDRADPAFALRRGGEKRFGLLAGVDQDRLGAFGIEDEIAVLGELAVGKRNDFEVRCRQAASAFPRVFRSFRYFSTAIAAVVASPTAVVTWRVSCARRSPAAKRPGIDVIIRSSVIR